MTRDSVPHLWFKFQKEHDFLFGKSFTHNTDVVLGFTCEDNNIFAIKVEQVFAIHVFEIWNIDVAWVFRDSFIFLNSDLYQRPSSRYPFQKSIFFFLAFNPVFGIIID